MRRGERGGLRKFYKKTVSLPKAGFLIYCEADVGLLSYNCERYVLID